MIIPLFVARTLSINAIDEALAKDRMIFLATQRDQTVEEPTPEQLYPVGTAALIMRILKMPGGRIKILVQGVARARTEKVLQEEPFLKVQVRRLREHEPAKGDLEVEALVRSVKEQMQKIALGIVPAFLHVSFVESRLPTRPPTDVMLIYAMYLVSGFVFGHCYVAMCRFEEK